MNINDKKWIDEVWEKLDKKLSLAAVKHRENIPYSAIDGVYDDKKDSPSCWTNGFWPGMMWLMYDGTKNEEYRITAERAEEFMDEGLKIVSDMHHDVGFMWHISSGANYRLTGNETSMARNLLAANALAARFNIKGGYIQAWKTSRYTDRKPCPGFAIIDCMMNIPILYWASEVTGQDRFKNIAEAHADKTMKHHIRPDGSVHHIVNYDPETGDVVSVFGGQGYGIGSSWSRGQAWALYGFTLSYIHTKNQAYLDTAKKVANYFIAACCDDYMPKCDFRSPAEPVYYDSSAGMIAACGLIELSRQLDEYEGKMYLNAAEKLVKAAADNFADWSLDTDGIIGYGTEGYEPNLKKHINMNYSDFYFAEAVNKLKGFNTFLW